MEFRRYNPGASGDPDRHIWPLRNYMWAKAGPLFCAQVEANIADRDVRYKVIDGFCAMWRFKLENLIRSDNTVATDQIIRYPPVSDASRYTFSLWAFPEETYPTVLPQYFEFCKKYDEEKQYRNNMLYVGYRILKDQQSLLSYSWDGNVMTIDPVSTANPGWETFLPAYNQFCSDHGGIPLPNQTPHVNASAGGEGVGRSLEAVRRGAQDFRPGQPAAERLFQVTLGRSVNTRREFHMLGTPWEQRKSKYDVVVIGSGYGGAITAARLAAADLNPKPSICILERGKEWQPGDFPETPGRRGRGGAQRPQSAGPLRTAEPSGYLRDQGLGTGRHVADQRQRGHRARSRSLRAV